MALLCGLSATMATSLAIAQEEKKPVEEKTMEEVIVTGSRIARPNLESTVPVTTVTAEELFQTGGTSLGDLLNDLPALRSTFSQSNSSRFLGTTGLNLLDLRGLGTQRTLVLVNGRRHVGSDILNNAVSPDTNTFPTDLVESIDVVTGGNSAVYGSDAIAGVVNFILKKDFEGLQVRGQGGISDEGDAGNYYASVLWGTNFMEDRGNIAINFEYAKQDEWFASDRDNLRKVGNFVVTDVDPAGSPNGSDGTPDRLFYDDIRLTSVASGGNFMIATNAMGAAAPCGRDSQGAKFNCPYLFMPDGTLVKQTGERIGLSPSGNFQGGNGSTGREYDLLAIYPKLDRYNFNLFGHLDVSEAFSPYIEAKYVRTESLRFGSPAFFQGGTTGNATETVRFDNPFLSDQARAVLQQARIDAGVNVGGAPGSATGPYAAASRLALRRNLVEFGPRAEDATRETTRIVLGVNGKMSENWSYDVSLNQGNFKEDTRVKGNMDLQRFGLAMDAVRNTNGQIVCNSQLTPNDPNWAYDPSVALSVSRLANDIAECVPLNPFGEGSITKEMTDYVRQDTTSVAEIKQFVASASITGDSSALFSLPAGAIGIAVGVEHRTEENYFKADDLVSSGMTFYNALPLFDPPKLKVSEVYTEFRVPILKELTMADELTLSLAGRYADYNGEVGGVFAYNAGLDYAPISSLRFRAGIARAVRAPSLVDLYSEQSQNFATINDPCSVRNRGAGSATRAANCAAAGIPTSYDMVYSATPEILSGGNPELTEETSDSLTAGLVWQPEWLSGFSFSADYFDIDIDDVITAPTAQQIMNACYDAPDLNNQFCGLFQRWGAAGGPDYDPAITNHPESPYALVNATLQQTLLNYASSTSRGVDFEVGYQHSASDGSHIKTRLLYTMMLQRDDFLDPANPNLPDPGLYELGDPKDSFNLNVDYDKGGFTLGYQLRYIGKMLLNANEDIYSVKGAPPQNADYADIHWYPSVYYQDVRLGYDFSDDINAYLGCDNITDELPPMALTGTGEGSGIYDVRARYFYAGVKFQF